MAAGLVIPRGSLLGIADILRAFDSNVTLAATDLVNVQSGQLEVADPGERIAGIVVKAATSSTSAAQVNITPYLTFVMDNDNVGTTFDATHIGQYFDITGGTGAQIVDTSTVAAPHTTTNSAQLICLDYNPQGIRSDLDTDTSVGLYMIKEFQYGQAI